MARIDILYRIVGITEVALGLAAITFAVFLYFYFRVLHPASDPHGILFLGGLAAFVFGLVAVACGLLFRRGVLAKVVSQVVFVVAVGFLYVEWFTSCTGWYF